MALLDLANSRSFLASSGRLENLVAASEYPRSLRAALSCLRPMPSISCRDSRFAFFSFRFSGCAVECALASSISSSSSPSPPPLPPPADSFCCRSSIRRSFLFTFLASRAMSPSNSAPNRPSPSASSPACRFSNAPVAAEPRRIPEAPSPPLPGTAAATFMKPLEPPAISAFSSSLRCGSRTRCVSNLRALYHLRTPAPPARSRSASISDRSI
mmetsp:Transcript_16787/g.56486  ORF Transcript_16787/g.56486 Transcript_16787/m.56486 type:complete len:213 (-) Transcript_16787:698-1336(-)